MVRKAKPRKEEVVTEPQDNVQSENAMYIEQTNKIPIFEVILRGVSHKIAADANLNLSTIFISLLNLNNPDVNQVLEATKLKLHDYNGNQIWPIQ
jgi:hypothetical protein